ncbi:hypothetical protein D1871_11300 [Nakamurella silvestris]|nr:hypothetical protein D1871_11300 [Nakamurella silvestris]
MAEYPYRIRRRTQDTVQRIYRLVLVSAPPGPFINPNRVSEPSWGEDEGRDGVVWHKPPEPGTVLRRALTKKALVDRMPLLVAHGCEVRIEASEPIIWPSDQPAEGGANNG